MNQTATVEQRLMYRQVTLWGWKISHSPSSITEAQTGGEKNGNSVTMRVEPFAEAANEH
jgi:hypothetical protein